MSALTHPSPNHNARRTDVVAVCVHWTGGSFKSALDWCQRPEAQVSYHEIIGPDGTVATLVEPHRRAWAVGKSVAPNPWVGTDGNSMTYNIALAGAPPVPPTAAQLDALVVQIRAAFDRYGWPYGDGFRVTGHTDWAWPRGRKADPEGSGWLSLADIRGKL